MPHRFLSGLKLVFLAALSWSPIHLLRVSSLRLAGANIGADVTLYHGYQVRAPKSLSIAQYTSIGERAVLDARGGLSIGDSVNISSQVQIWTAQHDWRSPTFDYVEGPVTIGHHAWIGPRSIILPGTVVGDGVIIAAGAVARGALAPWGLYAGVPARRVAERPREVNYHPGSIHTKMWFW